MLLGVFVNGDEALAPVAVVIPTHNRSAKLIRALESVAAQTVRPCEVVVVDDGSDEDIACALANFQGLDVTYLRNERALGACAARNRGWRATHSPFIAFLDSDDVWRADKLAQQLPVLEQDEGAVLVTALFSDLGDDKPIIPTSADCLTGDRLLTRNWVGTCSAPLVRRSALEAIDGFDETLPSCQDWDLWVRMADRGAALLVDQVLVEVDAEGPRLSTHNKGSLTGHRLFAAKHAARIAALAPEPRSALHLYLSRLFFQRRALEDSLRHLGLAIRARPTALFLALGFLIERLWKKLFG
ncbi:MAG: glycosyltransferase family 2 protein [Rhodospirillales bacterium]